MREISLNILDVAKNSVTAKATLIKISVVAETKNNRLKVVIEDNGIGMDDQLLARVTDPFSTTRTTRKVGMGLPLFKQAAEDTGGKFEILSKIGSGTKVTAVFKISSYNRMPMGNLDETILTLVMDAESFDLVFSYNVDGREFVFSTIELKKTLEYKDFADIEVLGFLKSYLKENIYASNGGMIL